MDFEFDAYVAAQVEKQHTVPTYLGKRPLDFSPFRAELAALTPARISELDRLLHEVTISTLQAYYNDHMLDSVTVTLYFLYRIRTYDVDRLNSVIELNPDALSIARVLDAERASKGARSPLHGVPILLKDNIGTGDRMHNTAGAKAMETARADRDAYVAERLRAAGAILLGKTNLSEWANFMTNTSNNGFSVLGGQTHNPYGRFDAGGSSSGSAVSVAANLIPVSVGSETSGSISYPSSENSIVGIKPSIGLVSRDRVIPITDAMDTLGPMARTVTDAAILLTTLSGEDPKDPITREAAPLHGMNFANALDVNALHGRRIGVCRPEKEVRRGDAVILDRIQTILRGAGAVLVDVPFPEDTVSYLDVLHYGMKAGLNEYLRATAAPLPTLEAIIAFNNQDLPNRAPYGQDLLEKTQEMNISREDYDALVLSNRQKARAVIDNLLSTHNVELLLSLGNYLSGTYAPAGNPAVIVPAGYRESGEPIGVSFVGAYLSEPFLISVAYAFEQASKARKPPTIIELPHET